MRRETWFLSLMLNYSFLTRSPLGFRCRVDYLLPFRPKITYLYEPRSRSGRISVMYRHSRASHYSQKPDFFDRVN
jgi:hypothetical protein